MDRLKGKVALISGGARGQGAAEARLFVGEGAKVVIGDVLDEECKKTAAGINAKFGAKSAVAIHLDVTRSAEWKSAVETCERELGGLDILVNNAGVIEPIAEIAASDPAVWARNIQINLIGAYFVVRAVLDRMLQDGGTIINVSSGAAYRPLEGWSSYCAGKAGLAMLTRSLVLETTGVRLFGFSPGTIDTDMQVKIRASGLNQVSQIPRANLSPVEHAVRGLLYLCNDDSDDLIGQDISMRDDAFRKRIGLG